MFNAFIDGGVAGCQLATDNITIAVTFLMMLAHTVTGDFFINMATSIDPDYTGTAKELALACLGTPS